MSISHEISVNLHTSLHSMNLVYSAKAFIYEVSISELFSSFISNIERLYIDSDLRRTRC